MSVCKIVFRADYATTCYDILDKQGRVLYLLDQIEQESWTEFREAMQDQQKIAIFRSEKHPNDEYRMLSISPTFVTLSFELAEGISLDKLYLNTTYTRLFKVIGSLLAEFKINKFRRCGIRFYYINQIGNENDTLYESFSKLIDQNLKQSIESNLGNIKDYRITLDGSHNDETKYMMSIGPYKTDEAYKFFEHIASAVVETQRQANFICDLDIYEHDISTVHHKEIVHWTKPLISKAEKSIKMLEKQILEKLGEG